MISDVEKPRVTEIQVRMDCNGCVQKIKRALHGINGIYDIYIDFPQQKLTIIGWADPEKILKAIRKTRKIATICSHTEPETATQPTEQPPDGGAEPIPEPEATNSPPAETPLAEAPPAAESPPPPENPPPEAAQAPSPLHIANDTNTARPTQPTGPKDVGEVHVIYHHPPPDYGYRYGYNQGYVRPWNKYPSGQGLPPAAKSPPPPENPPPEAAQAPSPLPIANDTNAAQPTHPPLDYGYRYGYCHGYVRPWNKYPSGQGLPPESSQPLHVTHSYNSYKPSPYVTEYDYTRSPPRYTYYNRRDHYNEDYHSSSNGNITSMFSDENPNACIIV
ncbi:hypothetical protein HS088_TW14G01183 [Tripterygium wilfordii]|uniref:HMA domain-containing protein n=1 Tax=Tripterygium wilfordii TaxID=458696 RepID=A0A7J7CSE1_TRIWF|nr:proline-rich protein 2-like [Tripterygium wilfordii]KAF5737027.1 hypothetical protein HS088_TW14G01183 [Tripterygium wilfordii]